jgi:hypothetical protein
MLFTELVLKRIEKAAPQKMSADPWPFLKIVLNAAECPALISRPDNGGGKYWDEPVNRLGRDVDLRLIDYYDWDEFNYVDFRYYKVKIAAFPAHPNLVGREALIETFYASIVVCPEK